MGAAEQILDRCKDLQNIFIFVSMDDEVDTRPIIRRLLEDKKMVIVPISNPEDYSMKISVISSLADLKKSTYGVYEPKDERPFDKNDVDIFIVPGTCFDKQGNRKGRGKAYFDRFLKDVKGKKPIIGLCKKEQMVDCIRPNPWDVPVDEVVVD